MNNLLKWWWLGMWNHPWKTQLYMTFTGKANKTENDPSKTLLYMTFTEKTDETENEFLCSNLRLHNLISSEVQKSVGVSKGVEFKSGTFFTKGRKGNLPISVAVAIKNHSLCKKQKIYRWWFQANKGATLQSKLISSTVWALAAAMYVGHFKGAEFTYAWLAGSRQGQEGISAENTLERDLYRVFFSECCYGLIVSVRVDSTQSICGQPLTVMLPDSLALIPS